MELSEIIKNTGKYKVLIAISILAGILVGGLFYFSPKTYYATGSFYVKRAVDTVKFKYFAYEGYYGQQTGLSYTNTVAALLESTDMRFEALNKLNLPTDTVSLQNYSRIIKVKKSGPQIVSMTIRNKNAEEAKNLWNTLADTTIEKSRQININGDPYLSISKISDSPIVRMSYRPLWLCVLSGAVSAPLLVILFLALKGYFKWK